MDTTTGTSSSTWPSTSYTDTTTNTQGVAALVGPPLPQVVEPEGRQGDGSLKTVWCCALTVLAGGLIALAIAFYMYFVYFYRDGDESFGTWMTGATITTMTTDFTTDFTIDDITEDFTDGITSDSTDTITDEPTTAPTFSTRTKAPQTSKTTETTPKPKLTEKRTHKSTQNPTEKHTQKPTEQPTQKHTEKPTETSIPKTTSIMLSRDKPNPFVCMINIFRYTGKNMLPPNGLCYYIFLDSLDREGKYPVHEATTWADKSFVYNYCKDAGDKYNAGLVRITRHGIAADIASASYFIRAENSSDIIDKAMKPQAKKLNLSYVAVPDFDMGAFINTTALSRVLFKGRYMRNVAYWVYQNDNSLAMGVTPTTHPEKLKVLLEEFGTSSANYYLLISLSHSSFLNFRRTLQIGTAVHFDTSQCLILPSMAYETTTAEGITHNITLKESLAFMETFVKVHPTIPKAISVSLKGRWYTPAKSGAQNLGLFKRCDNTSNYEDVAPYSVCEKNIQGQYGFDTKYMAPYFKTANRIMTFETEESLKMKICSMADKYKGMKYGIAVYDIDADFGDKPCDKVKYRGRNKRLELLKALNNFLEVFTTKAECLLVK